MNRRNFYRYRHINTVILILKKAFNFQSSSCNTFFLVIFAHSCCGVQCDFRLSPRVILPGVNIQLWGVRHRGQFLWDGTSNSTVKWLLLYYFSQQKHQGGLLDLLSSFAANEMPLPCHPDPTYSGGSLRIFTRLGNLGSRTWGCGFCCPLSFSELEEIFHITVFAVTPTALIHPPAPHTNKINKQTNKTNQAWYSNQFLPLKLPLRERIIKVWLATRSWEINKA